MAVVTGGGRACVRPCASGSLAACACAHVARFGVAGANAFRLIQFVQEPAGIAVYTEISCRHSLQLAFKTKSCKSNLLRNNHLLLEKFEGALFRGDFEKCSG